MPASPVRLAIASPDAAVAQGLRRLLAEQTHRVVVVDDEGDGIDVVLHDADGIAQDSLLVRDSVAVRVPLQAAVEEIVAMVEAAAAGTPLTTGDPREVELSAREVQVLALIAEGLTNQEIADRVFVSINSVKTYIRSAYRKVGVNSRSQAAVWALQHGIVRSAQ